MHYLIVKNSIIVRTTDREHVQKAIANAKPEEYNTTLQIYASLKPINKIIIQAQGKF